jgi:hypothetical protein
MSRPTNQAVFAIRRPAARSQGFLGEPFGYLFSQEKRKKQTALRAGNAGATAIGFKADARMIARKPHRSDFP